MRCLGACGAALLLGLVTSALTAQGQGTPPGVELFSGSRATAAVSLLPLRDLDAERSRIGARLHQCRAALDFSAADSAAFVSRLAERASEHAASGDVIEIVVTPRAIQPLDCGDPTEALGLLELRSAWIARDDSLADDRRIGSVALRRGSATIEPLAREEIALRALGDSGIAEPNGYAWRFTLRIVDVIPSRRVPGESLVIEIQAVAESVSERIELPWPVLRELLDASMPLRATALRAQGASIALPVPTDEGLRRAAASYESGDANAAARLAVVRLRSGALAPEDLRWARALSTLLFATAGDSTAARLQADYLLRQEPCFRFDDAAPSAVHAILDDADRPARRCVAFPAASVAWRALLVPGFGRLPIKEGNIGSKVVVFGMYAGALIRSQMLRAEARDYYRAYLRYQYVEDPDVPPHFLPEMYFRFAESTRATGRRWARVAAGIYVAQLGFALIAERVTAARLADVTDFGSAPARTTPGDALRLETTPGAAGLQLRWFW